MEQTKEFEDTCIQHTNGCDGSLVDDFRIHRVGRVTAVRNAPSPAATASMAIAEHICDAVFAGAGDAP